MVLKRFIDCLQTVPRWLGSFLIFLVSGTSSALILLFLALYALAFRNLFQSDHSGFSIYDLMLILSRTLPLIIALGSSTWWYRRAGNNSSETCKPETKSIETSGVIGTTNLMDDPENDLTITSEEELSEFNHNYYMINEIRTKVVGVTFRNDDGTDRQAILRHCHCNDVLWLRHYLYRGAPAFAVYTDYGQIGNISAELAADLATLDDNYCISGKILEVTGGYVGKSFGCNIVLTIYSPVNW